MNLSERNKKVALARWAKILSKEKEFLTKDNESLTCRALICGFLAGDGSVKMRKEKQFTHYVIECFPDDKLMLETYCQAIKKIYNKEPHISVRDNVYCARLTSRTIYEDLIKYGDFGIKQWKIPQKLTKTEENKITWIKAFFSAEAYVGKQTIKIQTINSNGMKELSTLLNELGIEHKSYRYSPKNEHYSDVAIIVLTKKASRRKYLEKIGFYHTRKSELLKQSLGL